MSSHFDLAVIGSGSANQIVDDRFADQRVAILEKGVFGGTCINVGCIPTKMYVYPADLALSAAHGPELGVETGFDRVRWPEVRDRIFGRIDPMSQESRDSRVEESHVTLFEGHARFVGGRTLDTGTGETITADQVVIATGSRPMVPEIAGLDSVTVHTSDTVMRLDELPERVLVLGGGYVAAEFAHLLSSFGSRVIIVNRGATMLESQDAEISAAFTRAAEQRWDLRPETEVVRVEPRGAAIRAHLSDGNAIEVDVLLVATGRIPNTDDLGLEHAGVEVDDDGLVVVDDHQRTTADGVWALGDVSGSFPLKHVANEEARVVQHNLLHPGDLRGARHDVVPRAVFSHPQIASVGLTEQDAVAQGVDHVVGRQQYGDTAYGWAMEDTTGFAKVLADPGTGRILGAHFLGPQASNLVQPIVQAMSFGQSARDVAEGQYWIHPALSEVVENLLLAVPDPASSGT